MRARIIPSGQITAYERWELPYIGEPAAPPVPEEVDPAGEIDAIRKGVYGEAYAQGYMEGVARAQVHCERLDGLMAALAEPIRKLDEQVEQEVVELAITMVRQLLGRAIRLDREALPVSSRKVSLHLHPEDAALVCDVFASSDGKHKWRIIEDLALTRGACQVSTDSAHVGARLERRLAAIFGAILGSGCAGDMPAAGADHDP